ncbi:MAG: PulJ/GspJ family protein [Limisphaerales bacterium]
MNFETPRARRRTAFTLIEILVAMVLMTLIVLALMAVFNSTQTAFRAGLTQSDVLESGRATMGLIRSDLETMTPSDGFGANSNIFNSNLGANFYVTSYNYPPLYQALPAVINLNIQRTNVLENFFILSRGNVNGSDSWIGTGYAVVTNSPDGSLYSLYRFTTNYPVMAFGPAFVFTNDFLNKFLPYPTNYSHLMDGVVDLQLYAFDNNGQKLNASYYYLNNDLNNEKNVAIYPLNPNEYGCIFYSNKVPASVEIEMGVVEDKTLQHAESLSGTAVTNYLAQHAGQVHIFRQRVPIRNVDPSAYQ